MRFAVGSFLRFVLTASNNPNRRPRRARIHGLIGQSVGLGVFGAGNPGVADGIEIPRNGLGFQREFLHVGVLDFPAPTHLLDNEFGVHEHLHLGGPEVAGGLQSVKQSAVFGDVVGSGTHVIGDAGQHRARGIVEHRPGACDAGVATAAAIGFDLHFHWASPAVVRTR